VLRRSSQLSVEKFFQSKNVVPDSCNDDCIYIAPSNGTRLLMASNNSCGKTVEEPWWAVNVHHSDCRALQIQRNLARWSLSVRTYGSRLIGPCSTTEKWISLSIELLSPVKNNFLYNCKDYSLINIFVHIDCFFNIRRPFGQILKKFKYLLCVYPLCIFSNIYLFLLRN
jgi:hypothetical protein